MTIQYENHLYSNPVEVTAYIGLSDIYIPGYRALLETGSQVDQIGRIQHR